MAAAGGSLFHPYLEGEGAFAGQENLEEFSNWHDHKNGTVDECGSVFGEVSVTYCGWSVVVNGEGSGGHVSQQK